MADELEIILSAQSPKGIEPANTIQQVFQKASIKIARNENHTHQ